jgi:hypothetical protein
MSARFSAGVSPIIPVAGLERAGRIADPTIPHMGEASRFSALRDANIKE